MIHVTINYKTSACTTNNINKGIVQLYFLWDIVIHFTSHHLLQLFKLKIIHHQTFSVLIHLYRKSCSFTYYIFNMLTTKITILVLVNPLKRFLMRSTLYRKDNYCVLPVTPTPVGLEYPIKCNL